MCILNVSGVKYEYLNIDGEKKTDIEVGFYLQKRENQHRIC